ncbi:unnamed protein product [Allacma fusca]|uniref:CRAL-TRIO domain-containing protein n=1 Tax=Allacma fusca TaxID=39272 RepID=A0A8J2J1G1_9HEXA|nr:unnamed protein product [Allacma fusca]
MKLILTALIILLSGAVGSHSQTEQSNSVSENQNDRLLEYVLNEVQETFGKMDWTLLGEENVTLPNGENIEEYEAPYGIPQRFPYYLAGVDEEKRPLWISEWGKWNLKEAVEENQLREFGFYFLQLSHRVIKSIYGRSTSDLPITRVSCILDFGDLNVEQVVHVPTVTYVLTAARLYREIIEKRLGEATVINANYPAVTLINLLRPVLGGLLNRVTVHGTNKSRWLPKLLRKIPPSSIPEWYGGTKEFKPIEVYG